MLQTQRAALQALANGCKQPQRASRAETAIGEVAGAAEIFSRKNGKNG